MSKGPLGNTVTCRSSNRPVPASTTSDNDKTALRLERLTSRTWKKERGKKKRRKKKKREEREGKKKREEEEREEEEEGRRREGRKKKRRKKKRGKHREVTDRI